ncbi:MAG: RluA family pseudouridine synthase [Planctomycetaceae bacterium]|nr:RluA family pseudouridine synthase [Planctomycetaceae bacterium]
MAVPRRQTFGMAPFTVAAPQDGKTVLAALRELEPGKTWSQWRASLSRRAIFINGCACLDERWRVRAGDEIEVRDSPAGTPLAPPRVKLIDVRDQFVVIAKPPGVISVRRPEERRLSAASRRANPTADELAADLIASRVRNRRYGTVNLLPVHRLDRDASGLLVFARNPTAREQLIQQFARHAVLRRYLAFVVGNPPEGRYESRLVDNRGDGRRGSQPGEKGQIAITDVRVLEEYNGRSLCDCHLQTGRTNQIRIHLAERGYPLCGESKYLIKPDGPRFPADPLAPRLALHAEALGFDMPGSGEWVEYHEPLPPDLATFHRKISRSGSASPPSL